MQLNFFTWIREGVKQSVLLGVSDALEQLGTPDSDEQVSDQLAGMLQTPKKKKTRKSRAQAGQPERKALGRSLKEVDQDVKKAA